MKRPAPPLLLAVSGAALAVSCSLAIRPSLARATTAPPRPLDPAAWGVDHVGKPLPEYVTGDECLFCHRRDVGPGWAASPHGRTVREADPASPGISALKQSPALAAVAGEVKLEMGGRRRIRYLRPAAEYGKLELLSTEWIPPRAGKPDRLAGGDTPRWEAKRFADGCAGCHATAVETATRAFSAVSLDCFACHGSIDPNHSRDPRLAYLSPRRQDPARVVISTCASCHARGGRSRSTGLPYPNQFVPGDNLFRDFQVDQSPQALSRLNSADRHVLENIRDVALSGRVEVTCLSCHDVHRSSTEKHRRLPRRPSCGPPCHPGGGRAKTYRPEEFHSKTCGY